MMMAGQKGKKGGRCKRKAARLARPMTLGPDLIGGPESAGDVYCLSASGYVLSI